MDNSSASLNKSTIEHRRENLRLIKTIHFLLSIELILAVVWSSFCLYFWDDLGAPIVHWWEFGIVAGALVILLLLAALIIRITKYFPVNWIVYILFTLSLAHILAFFSCLDKTMLVYFTTWCLCAIICGVFIQSLVAIQYIGTLESILLVFSTGALALFAFLVFSEINPLLLVLVYAITCVYGVFLTRSLRSNIRALVYDTEEEEPVSGAVKIWSEGLMVFCRIGELFGTSITRL
jgi:hypothetical protein